MSRKTSKKTAKTVATTETVAEVNTMNLETTDAMHQNTIDPTLPMGENGNSLIDDVIDQLEAVEAAYADSPVALEKIPEDADFVAIDHMATQAASWADPSVQDAEPVQAVQATSAFDQMLQAVDDTSAEQTALETAAQIDNRSKIELEKKPDNNSIQGTLKSARKLMVTKRAARVLVACKVSPNFITRNSSENQRYNVYAIGKIADAIFALSGGEVSNAINRAVMRTLFKFKDAGVPFSMENAKQACSQNIRVDDRTIKNLLVRHTVSPSTAPTQAGSTMQALETLGVVTRSGSKNPIYTVVDGPITEKLREVVMRAA